MKKTSITPVRKGLACVISLIAIHSFFLATRLIIRVFLFSEIKHTTGSSLFSSYSFSKYSVNKSLLNKLEFYNSNRVWSVVLTLSNALLAWKLVQLYEMRTSHTANKLKLHNNRANKRKKKGTRAVTATPKKVPSEKMPSKQPKPQKGYLAYPPTG